MGMICPSSKSLLPLLQCCTGGEEELLQATVLWTTKKSISSFLTDLAVRLSFSQAGKFRLPHCPPLRGSLKLILILDPALEVPFSHSFIHPLLFTQAILSSGYTTVERKPDSVPAPVPAPHISIKSCWITFTLGKPSSPKNSDTREVGVPPSMHLEGPPSKLQMFVHGLCKFQVLRQRPSWVWQCKPEILEFGRLRQEDLKFKASLGYIARPCLQG
jgi:hypothetical protein